METGKKSLGRIIIDGRIIDLDSLSLEEISKYIEKLENEQDQAVKELNEILHVYTN